MIYAQKGDPLHLCGCPLNGICVSQKGTLVLKEMLKIDGAGTESSPSPEVAANGSGRQQSRRQSAKKLGI